MATFQPVRAVTSQYRTIEESLSSGAEIVSLLEKLGVVTPDAVTIHIGCGLGRVELFLHRKVRFCYGIDVSPVMIRHARNNVRAENVRFICADSLSAVPEEVQLIYSFYVFQHLPRQLTHVYIGESHGKLAQGGKLVAQMLVDDGGTTVEPPANHPYGLRYYTRNELRRVLNSAGFVDMEFLTFPGGQRDDGATGDLLVVASKA
jgi:SAM-dependent methyltransferase